MNRKTAIDALRARLRSGGSSVGAWMQIPHPSVAEIMGRLGYEWVALDLEHGAISAQQLPDLCRALELGSTLPLVRLAEGAPRDCKEALDAGAGGVIVPMVESAGQLAAVRDASRWPPGGTRGVGFSRANLFGKDFSTYVDEAQAPLLVAMIEHQRAVLNLADILAVDGLDAILIGPYDLSASMGMAGRFAERQFISVLAEIKGTADGAGVPCGVHVVEPVREVLHQRLAEGFRFIAYGTDALFLMRGGDREA